eukprot:GHVO01014869.1.p2 GENE.GHVO01014869.1~~GHVO01014869.1.p2  ORF type:complete len:100 (+),score=23.53 GHVO01014869.1:486-785(+)
MFPPQYVQWISPPPNMCSGCSPPICAVDIPPPQYVQCISPPPQYVQYVLFIRELYMLYTSERALQKSVLYRLASLREQFDGTDALSVYTYTYIYIYIYK